VDFTDRATRDRDVLLNNFAAELTRAAYYVALRHGTAGTWLDPELDLWQTLADTVKQWGRESPLVTGQPEASHSESRDGLGHGRCARRSLSGE
jgi:hypothetical protein